MNDYFSAAAGLSAGKNFASSMLSPGDPLFMSLSAVATQPTHALLGALFESLVAQDSGADELKKVNQALDLWTEIKELIGQLRTVRSSLEAGVMNATEPNQVDAAIVAIVSARDTVLPRIKDWTKQAVAFLQDPKLLDYLPNSGQAADSDPKTWNWHELVTTRRTGALRHALLQEAAGIDGSALALGTVSSYATRLTIGSWRNAVVGGPPRNHPVRSRLVGRTSGAWLRAHRPMLTPSLSEMLDQLETSIGRRLPASVDEHLTKAMKSTYGMPLPGKALPDFKKAYRSMLRHIEILDQLRFWVEAPVGQLAVPVISSPKPPPVLVMANASTVALVSAGGNNGGGVSSTGQGNMIQIQSGFVDGVPVFSVAAKAFTGKTDAPWWKIVLAIAVTFIGAIGGGILGGIAGAVGGPGGIAGGAALGASLGANLGAAFGEWIGAWENKSPDYYAQGQQALEAPEAAFVCKQLFDLDLRLYSAASQFLTVLKGVGLAYPETPDLSTPPFAELLTVQSIETHRAMPTLDSFAAYPTSPVEQAVSSTSTPGSPYGPGESASAAIDSPPTKLARLTASSLTLALWRDHFHGGQALNQHNHNLESDRGFMMPCWHGKTQSQPITINQLSYGAI